MAVSHIDSSRCLSGSHVLVLRADQVLTRVQEPGIPYACFGPRPPFDLRRLQNVAYRDQGAGKRWREDNTVLQARAQAVGPRYDPGRVDQAGD